MSKIIIHFGLHKTASGSLQRQFFPSCQGLRFFTTLDPIFYKFYLKVAFSDPIYFDYRAARALMAPHLSDDFPNLLSNEAFSGPLYSGAIENCLDHRKPIVENLQATYPNAKAVLVIRKQDTYAASVYRQYLKAGGTRRFDRFYGFGKYADKAIFPKDRFNYTPFVRLLERTFTEGLLILTFEEFVHSQNSFLRRLTEFIGTPLPDIVLRKENATKLGPIGLELSRIFNYFFRSRLNPAGFLPGVPHLSRNKFNLISPTQYLHDKWFIPVKKRGKLYDLAQEILKECHEFNRELDDYFLIGLQKYGYW